MKLLSVCIRMALMFATVAVFINVPEAEADSDRTAIVQVRINTAYDDSDPSLKLLTALTHYGPTRKTNVNHEDTISSIIVREYGFGGSNLPKTYALLVDAIVSKNGLQSPEQLHEGSLIIPAIPRRAFTDFNSDKSINYVANITSFKIDSAVFGDTIKNSARVHGNRNVMSDATDASEIAYSRTAATNANRAPAQTAVVNYELPISVAGQFVQMEATTADISMFSYPLPVVLASEGACDLSDISNDHKFLQDDERQQILQSLTQAQRPAVMFILDTGWPNLETYQDSRNALYDVLDAVWQEYFKLAFPRSIAQPSISESSNPHCKCIERAIIPLRQLDAQKNIKVIYIPLTREQSADTILTDLLQTSYLLNQIHQPGTKLTPAIIDVARQEAHDVVTKEFPSSWTGNEVQTDKSILDAVLMIGNKYAESKKTVFLVNESWTVLHEEYFVYYPSPLYGAVTAATGNNQANVNTNLFDFAQRSTNNKDTIAVMNIQGSNLTCLSATIDPRDLDSAQAVGFDGQVTDQVCGTSFAAPRVAWIIAAGESVRTGILTQQRWGIELHDCLIALRDNQLQGFAKARLRAGSYVRALASGNCNHTQ